MFKSAVLATSLFLATATCSAAFVGKEYTNGYTFEGNYPANSFANGDPHNLEGIDFIFKTDVEPIVTNTIRVHPENAKVTFVFEKNKPDAFHWNVEAEDYVIVGFGIKSGSDHYYFSLDEPTLAAAYGFFNFPEQMLEAGFSSWKAIDHIDIFGYKIYIPALNVSAPGTSFLLMIGILFFAILRYFKIKV